MDADEEMSETYVLAEDVEFPHDEDDECVVTRVADFIADLEWQLDLDDSEAADVALEAGWQLVMIYTEMIYLPARDRVLSRLQWIVDSHPTPERMHLLRAIFGSLAAHPGQQ
jgi:hypothetical protein